MLRRRQILGGAVATGVASFVRAARARSQHWELDEIRAPGDKRVGDRFTLLMPRHGDASTRWPLLVLLHGLGETGDLRMGAHAWIERYGLGSAYDRLREPPLQALESKGRHWRAERLVELNEQLRRQSFRGMAIACPYTPNVYKAPDRTRLLDDYASWIVDVVLPRARAAGAITGEAAATHLDGCSLGGYVSLEVLLRKPDRFGGWGSVQGALGAHRLPHYAQALAATMKAQGPKPILLETSSGDAFREVNEQFSRKLREAGVAHDLLIPPGPHNQPFLRDSGTPEMLLWHDRTIGRPA